MIKWKEAQAGSGRWTADIGGETALFVWPFKGEYCFDFSLARGVDIIRDAGYPTLDAAKSAAETFAREWVAAQAAALGDGWVSVEERLPEDDRNVLVFISAPHAPYCYGIGSYGPMNGPRWRSRDIMFRSHFVSHWRPLPPRPEVK